ncbi:hypothetical protein MetMK1DRAFT_00014890 [Metallosphaera yellowstonensis MK1]|uniref:Uncharacterized protein n=1 Tax=Metallosphaera yellowstonensis MK1 TaxID=671065 RepID=H2C4G7_9CREN|nr:hypothetical protein [Metallosphaera yellowstonensis]EHP70985.1 hypothetical protein MetMK1DRAFT_00014890 [Metallosphaera yellowstonensis MK1]
MNLKVWGPILSGGVLVAISVIMLTLYSYTLLKPNPASFAFTVTGTDLAGLAISIIGLALIMVGAYMQD